MPAFIRSLSCWTPHGSGIEVLRGALADKVFCPRRATSLAIGRELAPAGWIEPLSRPSPWRGKPVRLGRLDRLSQLCLLTAFQAAELAGGVPDDLLAGVALGTAHGCHLTNEQFFAGLLREGPQGASPTLFAYTLPSSAAGELAIHLQLKGPTLTLCHGRGSALSVMGAAGQLIEQGKASWMLVGGADTLAPGQLRSQSTEAALLAEGAAFFVLSTEGEGSLGRIASYGMGFGPGALERATQVALVMAGWGEEKIKTRIGPEVDADWRRVCGDTRGAEPLLQLGLALTEGRPLPALVAARDVGGGVEVMCVGDGAEVVGEGGLAHR